MDIYSKRLPRICIIATLKGPKKHLFSNYCPNYDHISARFEVIFMRNLAALRY